MTKNQNDYWRNVEQKRANQAAEAENKRHNLATERLGKDTLQETSRHNVAQENIGRSNVQLGYSTLDETRRHNLNTELLTSQRNAQDYEIAWRNVAVAQTNANTNRINANTNRLQADISANLAQTQRLQYTRQATADSKDHEIALRNLQYNYDRLEQEADLKYADLNTQIVNRTVAPLLTRGIALLK